VDVICEQPPKSFRIDTNANNILSHASITAVSHNHITSLWIHKGFEELARKMLDGLCLIIDNHVHHTDYQELDRRIFGAIQNTLHYSWIYFINIIAVLLLLVKCHVL
jgi:hypothetical protein